MERVRFEGPCCMLTKQLPKAACNLSLQDMTALLLAEHHGFAMARQIHRSHACIKEHSLQALRGQVCIFWLEASALHCWDKGLGHSPPTTECQHVNGQDCLASCMDPGQQDHMRTTAASGTNITYIQQQVLNSSRVAACMLQGKFQGLLCVALASVCISSVLASQPTITKHALTWW